MQIKFFDKDIIGKLPTRMGDTFQANFFGGVRTFKVEECYRSFYMARMVDES